MPASPLEQIERHAAQRPDALAAVEVGPRGDGVSITWRQFRNAVGVFAKSLRTHLQPGDAILLVAPNSVRYLVAFHACLAADLSVFPFSAQSSERERRDAARRSGAVACIGHDDSTRCFGDLALKRIPLEDVPLNGDDGAAASGIARCDLAGSLLLQSSGTTGLPKIVRRSLEALMAVGENCRRHVGVTPQDHMLAVIPISHSYGIDHAVLGAILAGCTVQLCDGFDAKWTRQQLAARRITLFPAVPFIYESLAQAAGSAHRLPDLRQAFSAGSPLPRRVFDAFLQAFDVPIGQIYGSTEFGSITFNDPAVGPFDPLSVGRPMSGIEVRIVDRDQPRMDAELPVDAEGQIAVAATSMLSEYVGVSEPVLSQGMLLPGDLGRLDNHGRLFITGRTKLLIDVGGLKVNPLEVEAALAEHPSVKEVIVLAMPLSETIQRVKAIVVWREGGGDVEELRRFARLLLSPHKVPRIFEERAALPKTATGKIIRSALQSA